MGLTKADKDYIEGLIQPVSTKIDELAQIKAEFEAKFQEQNKLIDKLVKRVDVLESTCVIRQKVIDRLVIASDDNQQYSRRESIRIHGIEPKEGESNDDVVKIVEDCHKSMTIPFNRKDIARCHRVGPPRTNEKTGKKTQAIIVKYTSWGARAAAYKARPKHDTPARKKFSVAPDLTKRRLDLLAAAQEKIKAHKQISFAFADINCALGMRFTDGKMKYFNSEAQLGSILEKLTPDA